MPVQGTYLSKYPPTLISRNTNETYAFISQRCRINVHPAGPMCLVITYLITIFRIEFEVMFVKVYQLKPLTFFHVSADNPVCLPPKLTCNA